MILVQIRNNDSLWVNDKVAHCTEYLLLRSCVAVLGFNIMLLTAAVQKHGFFTTLVFTPCP